MKDELKEAFGKVLPLRLSKQAQEEVCGDFVGMPKKITAARAIALAITAKAMRGDVKAYDIIREAVEPQAEAESFRIEVKTEE